MGRMGLPPLLHPGPAAGWAVLPCSPISPHPSIATWQAGKRFPRYAGDCCSGRCLQQFQSKPLPTHPGLFDGLEPQRVCREIVSSPARCWLSTACLVKTSCIKLRGFNLLSLASPTVAGVVVSYPAAALAWPK